MEPQYVYINIDAQAKLQPCITTKHSWRLSQTASSSFSLHIRLFLNYTIQNWQSKCLSFLSDEIH